ncbi:hypothetical protein GCM10007939_10880 [Amylibacter marinus]|uniref:Polyhydroxybutyrate depolymerase n=1 Tax=Amylibacter marinus TaxID=1475483 RepID=A0ABQ5VTP1_9RHOB|nr:PHB depolymerase family esterase [Amylibacter marinus]GLQ34805.1 hypothetical protein GCM10007939_10880 [Amylibacter marinus]
MRFLISILTFLFIANPVFAERFQGRIIEIVDGRADPSKPAPVVIALHPFLGTAASMRKSTGFDILAKRNGIVAVFATGLKRKWNDGRNSRPAPDDVKYLSNLIGNLVLTRNVDPKRVFLAGHSNGGGMAMRMACDRPDLIAGISVAATKLAANYTCANGKSVPAIFFYGTEDTISPHAGRPAGRLGETISATATIANWAKRNKCGNAHAPQVVDRHNDGTKAEIYQYSRCRKALTYVEIEGHGHGWPGGAGQGTRLQGPASKEINATSMTWRFFNGR